MRKSISIKVGLIALSAFVSVPMVSSAFSSYHSFAQGALSASDNALEASVGASIEAEMNTDTKSNTQHSTTTTSTKVEIDNRSNESQKGSSTKTMLRVNPEGITITSSSQVETDEDLEIFSANLSAEDEGVDRIDIQSGDNGESEVEVVYKHNGKLFGFIPVTLKSKTVVEAKSDSEVDVRAGMPWWSFLVADENYSAEDLESQIKSDPTIKANAVVNASAEAKARVAEAVLAIVATNAQISTSK